MCAARKKDRRKRTPPSPSPTKRPEESPPRRINQILSQAGLTSRRKADQWITEGRVTLNGRVISRPGVKAVWGRDRIEVDGREIPSPERAVYVMLNKPFGTVSSLKDPEGRPVVTDLLPSVPERVYPVGRLDFDTIGLLLLTNDGYLAHRLLHPRYRVPRTYKATVTGVMGPDALSQLSNGVTLQDGTRCRGSAALLSSQGGRSVVRLTIHQGKTRQVRRMLEAVGHPVIHLIRTHFGNLALGRLQVGQFRHLSSGEVEQLRRLVKLKD